jgi:hypothetical protein
MVAAGVGYGVKGLPTGHSFTDRLTFVSVQAVLHENPDVPVTVPVPVIATP